MRQHFSLDNLRYSFICQFKITKKITTNVVIYCAVPGVGGHKVIKPSPRTALTIFRNMHRHDTFVENFRTISGYARSCARFIIRNISIRNMRLKLGKN